MNGDFFIRAGHLVDGSGRPAARDALICVEAGRIADILPGASAFAPPPPGAAPVLDFSCATIIPGLVDAHAHLCWSGTSDPAIRKAQLSPDEGRAFRMIRDHVRDHLAAGVSAVRDGGDRLGRALAFASAYGGPLEIRAAGRAWHAPGRYGGLIGRPVPPGLTLASAIASDPEPGHHVKVVQSGLNSLTEFGKRTRPQFSLEELTLAVDAARSRGLSVMAHANGEEAVKIAAAAGCASIEHGFFMGRENLKRLAGSGCLWIPTAATMQGYADSLAPESPEAATARRMLDHQIEQIALARSYGATLATGTDAGSPGVFHGRAVHRELALFLRAGFTPEEAVRAATANGARLLGLPRSGLLAPGSDATFLALSGPPAALPESLATPIAFYIKGKRVDA